MGATVISRRVRVACACFLVAVVVAQFAFAIVLVRGLPENFPNGGPDEPMHVSVSKYIAEHLTWPRWDTPELERYENGTSYATSSSLGYWLDGLSLRVFGRTRLAGLILFTAYLAVVVFCFRKSTLAGLFALAAAVPQFLFVCSYVNSDAWTAVVALALGLAVALFRREPGRTRNIVFLFVAAGACITCRFHMWPIGFVAFAYALVPQLKSLVRERLKPLLAGLALGIVVALWWPVTSYFANDGDFVGFTAQAKSVEKFGNKNAAPLSRPWSEIHLAEYTSLVGKSFYGVWGWANFELAWGYYLAALLAGLFLIVSFWRRSPKFVGLSLALLIFNFALMLVYSIQYDYQWQGRYLFPWFFISVGLIVGTLTSGTSSPTTETASRGLLLALVGFSAFNIFCDVQLWRSIEKAEQSDPTDRGYLMLKNGHLDAAVRDFELALSRDERNASAINGMGLVALAKHDTKQAEAEFRKAIAVAPDDPQGYANLADLLMENNQFAEAIENYEAVATRDPSAVYIQLQLVAAYRKVGDLEKAVEHCRQAQKLAPRDEAIRRRCVSLERELARRKAGKP